MRDNHEKSVQPAAQLIVGLLDEANDALNSMVALRGDTTKAMIINEAIITYAKACQTSLSQVIEAQQKLDEARTAFQEAIAAGEPYAKKQTHAAWREALHKLQEAEQSAEEQQ